MTNNDIQSREQNLQTFRKKFLCKLHTFIKCQRYTQTIKIEKKITTIRSMYLLLLRNKEDLTSPKFTTDTEKFRELPLQNPENDDWDLVMTSFHKATEYKRYIKEMIVAGNNKPYYRLVLLTLTNWKKHVHRIVLNDTISYYQKIPKVFPIELKTHIVSYLISQNILQNV
jgi:hypothetical protein